MKVTLSFRDAGTTMVKLDHIRIAVRDYRASRDWYIEHLGLKLEFEVPSRGVAAIQDDSGLTLFLERAEEEIDVDSCILFFQVADVKATYRGLTAGGIRFVHPPRRRFWGYGAELKDPDGYRIRLWDKRTMNEKG